MDTNDKSKKTNKYEGCGYFAVDNILPLKVVLS